MRRPLALAALALVLALGTAGLPAGGQTLPAITSGGDPSGAFSVLVFSKTAAFRHASIPTGVTALQQLGVEHGFTVDATEDATAFADAVLAQYDAVVFLSTTGDVLDAAQQAAFERYIRAGGGYAGIHAASDTEYAWPWYGDLVGAYFAQHPAIADGVVNVDDRAHPSTAHLPARWGLQDEWYDFQTNPRGRVHVLATADETSYSGGTMGRDHPLVWCQDYDGGRSWYSALGHGEAQYRDPLYLGHLLGGIRTAAGVEDADCGATLEANFAKVPIDTETAKPIRLAAAPDGRIFYLEQAGQVKVYDPATGEITVAADFVRDRGIYNEFENGTVGIALDPAFSDNGWVYLYYSPSSQEQPTVPSRGPGKFGNGQPLSGSGEYVELPEGVVSELEDFTISAWVRPTAIATWQRIFDFGNGPSTNMFLTASAGQRPRFAITTGGNGAGSERQMDGVPMVAGQWQHVAVTLVGSTATLYQNGVPVDVEPNMDLAPADLGVTTQNWIGRSQYPDPYLNGTVDEFQIWDRGLSAAEVLSLQLSANGTTGGGNVVRYDFDAPTGAAVTDASGAGNDGRVVATGARAACPATEASTATCGELLLSRFTMVGETLDLDSERVLLRVPHQRDTCCHTTGDLAFDAAGNLYVSTGDDTRPWDSSGYTPIDERAGRNAWDAQRTSANTNDLRGKILRIHPEPDGTYTIPEDNLFPPGTALTRPEIYAMGMRNPFTITVDPATQALVVSEYGPDSTLANPLRGPEGRVELNYMTQAGNYGWPYCIAENTPYRDYDFATQVSTFEFDCANPVNDSPNNTGLRELPPAIPSTLYQSISTSSAPAHTMGQGSAPMTGPFVQHDPAVDAASDVALPAYYDGVQLYTDWNKGFLYEIHRDDEQRIRTINRFLPSTDLSTLRRPIEVVQAADGSLYLAEWGTEQFFGPNADSGIYRVEYRGG